MRTYPCCMCPAQQYDFQKDVCDENTTFMDQLVGKCDFVNRYVDDRGWIFFVRAGLGENNYKTFYKKTDSNSGGHGYKNLPWRETFRAAQEDLNKLAQKKGWKII